MIQDIPHNFSQNFNLRRGLTRVVIAATLLFGGIALAADGHADVDLDDTPSAFGLFKEQAEQGDVEAQYNLGVMYETGWSVNVDNKKAVRWFRAAADQGHPAAQLRLGMLYYLGFGASQSNIKGEKWIRKAAKQGQPLAEKLNEVLFAEDFPDALTPSSAMKQVRAAYLKNERKAGAFLDALIRKARQKDRQAKKEKDETTLRERRSQRSVDGPVRPGFSTPDEVERVDSAVPAFIGDSTLEENRTLARGSIATIQLQAEKGLASAQYNLGRMYELGIKLPVDKKRAMEWYEKSANQAYADAEYRLGIALLYGAGVMRDEQAGKKWLGLAAMHDHPVAKNMMADIKGKSSDSARGMSQAVQWYLERAVIDDGQAAFHLGKIYEHGWGVERDFAEAIKWYQQSSLSGNKEAQTLADKLQPRLGEVVTKKKQGRLSVLLEQYGLPDWLGHPVVIVAIVAVLLWPLFFSGIRRRRKSMGEEIQEI